MILKNGRALRFLPVGMAHRALFRYDDAGRELSLKNLLKKYVYTQKSVSK